MIKLIEKGTISSKIAKKVFKELIENGEMQKQSSKKKDLSKFLTKVRCSNLSQKHLITTRNPLKTLKMVKTARLAS